MSEPPFIFTLEKLLERFGTRDALIDFILDIKDKDTDKKKKAMNVFVCFRKVYNAVLPPSSSRRQFEVSKEAGKAWVLEKQYNWDFWKCLLVDVYLEHANRFPSSRVAVNKALSNLLGTSPELEAVLEVPLPQPGNRDRENGVGAERTRTSMSRPAPYTLSRPGSSSSSRSLSPRSSSSSSSYPVTNSQASPYAAPLLSTPPSFPAYPSVQSAPMVPLDGHAGWQASGVQVLSPMFPSATPSALGGGGRSQYPPSIQPALAPAAAAPLDVQVQNQYPEQGDVPASYYWTSRTVEGPSGPYREIRLFHGERELSVGSDMLSQIQAIEALSIPFPVWSLSGNGSVNGVAPTSQ